jgi:hypothetical protein
LKLSEIVQTPYGVLVGVREEDGVDILNSGFPKTFKYGFPESFSDINDQIKIFPIVYEEFRKTSGKSLSRNFRGKPVHLDIGNNFGVFSAAKENGRV